MATAYRGDHNGVLEGASKRQKLNPASGILPCLICKEQFRRRHDLWQHLTTSERGINVFVCLNCGHGFCRDRLLRDHHCDTITNRQNSSMAESRSTALSVFSHIIACEECGLFVALVNVENPSWRGYGSFCGHPSRSFRKITLYTWTSDSIRFIRNDMTVPITVLVDSGPAVTDRIPLACNICGEKYSSVDDIEKHMAEFHCDTVLPIECEQCRQKFSSLLSLKLHADEVHGGSVQELVAFLKTAVVEEPFVETTSLARTASYVYCDLCNTDVLGEEFNHHDCAANYTRRYLFNGKVICCPAAVLHDFTIDMGVQDSIMVSVTERSQRRMELCLRFYTPLDAPRIEDFQDDRVYACKHCEHVFINQPLFCEHIAEVLGSQSLRYEWTGDAERDHRALIHFGWLVAVSESGLLCPKTGCCNTCCSPVALERHMRNNHADEFEELTLPALPIEQEHPESSDTPPNALSCMICRESDFSPHFDLRTHVREQHLHPCTKCGRCFDMKKRLEYHQLRLCKVRDGNSARMCYCVICNDAFTELTEYYLHLTARHPSEAKHDQLIGEILPTCGFFLPVNKEIIPNLGQTVSNGLSTSGSTLSCSSATFAEDIEYEVHVTAQAEIIKTEPNQSIDQDDEIVVYEPAVESDQPVRVASEEHSDDEVAVCSPDSGSNKRRERNYGCEYCSKKFYTQKAAEEHGKTHNFDAGETTDLVLAVPGGVDVYICRSCCLAYESYSAYRKHMENHKPKLIECHHCSALCLNSSQLSIHLDQHSRNGITYGCYQCLIATRTETGLMIHLNLKHDMPLMWFCIGCGLANSEWRTMDAHQCTVATTDGKPIILPTTKPKLHFQPEDVKKWTKDPMRRTEQTDVAECWHRTFLASQKGSMMACQKCGSVIDAVHLILSSSDKEKNDGRMKLALMEEHNENQLINSHPFYKRNKASLPTGPNRSGGGLKTILPKPAVPPPLSETTPNYGD